jgi:hypothetical protein
MDLLFLFVLAVIMSVATAVARKVLGKKVARVITFVLTLAVIAPLVLIIVFGVARILNSSPVAGLEAGRATAKAVFAYLITNLPGIVISEVAGVFVGHTIVPIIHKL